MLPDNQKVNKMKLTQTHEEMIRSFAKTKKISCSKIFEIATQLFETVEIKESTGFRGRKASPDMLVIRNKVLDYLKNQSSEFTTIDISKAVNCDLGQANNALTYCKKDLKIIAVGKAEKQGKGKKPTLYKVEQ